jgi:hypothetical protein
MRNPYHLGNVGDEVSRSGVMAASGDVILDMSKVREKTWSKV